MKSILITGASSGIGRATALEFLNAGWRVGLLARRAIALNEVAQAHETPLRCLATSLMHRPCRTPSRAS